MKNTYDYQTSKSPIWLDILATVLIMLCTTMISFVVSSLVKTESAINLQLIFFLGILIISCVTSRYIYGIAASFLEVIILTFVFTEPAFTLSANKFSDPLQLLSVFTVSVITSILTTGLKKQTEIAVYREETTNILYEFAKKILVARGMNNIVSLAKESIGSLFQCEVVVYTAQPNVNVTGSSTPKIELEAAYMAYSDKVDTGRGAKYCCEAKGYYVPIVFEGHAIGVVGTIREDAMLSQHSKHLLKMMISQMAMAIEYQNLFDEQEQILVKAEREKMRSNLLRAISHDLRTPLTGILGASSVLIDSCGSIDKSMIETLARGIRDDSQWLIRMVENLLSVTRISDGTTKVVKHPEAAEEIVAEAVGRVRTNYPTNTIRVTVPDELLMIPMDATLIEQVIINLIENAIKHGGLKVAVDINVYANEKNAVFEVGDNGNGIPQNRLGTLFDATYIGNKGGHSSDSSRGMGIGLSICKTIVEAHMGKIKAENRERGGAMFTFTLPLTE